MTSWPEMREIKGFPGYYVNKDGDLFSEWGRGCWGKKTTIRKLTPILRPDGYHGYTLYSRGKIRTRLGHHLVLEAFVGNRPPGCECRHLNSTRDDNRLSNLRWGSRAENERDKIANGTSNRGSRNGQSKLNEEDIVEIRDVRKKLRLTHVEIAKMFGVTQSIISTILSGKRWAHVR